MNLTGSIDLVTYGVTFDTNQRDTRLFERKSLPFPLGAQIKEVIGGGTFFVIRSDSDELFFKSTSIVEMSPFMSYLSGTTQNSSCMGVLNYCHFNYKKIIEDLKLTVSSTCYELNEVHCGQCSITLRMMNDLLIYFPVSNCCAMVDESYVTNSNRGDSRKLKHVYVGVLSQHLIAHKTDHTIDYLECDTTFFKKDITISIPKGHIIVNCACSGRSTFIVVEDPYDRSHYLYVHGDNQFMVQSGTSTTNCFTKLTNIPFFGKRVKDIKCGYFHTCILLEDGSVYTCGYNNYKQLGYSGGNSALTQVQFPNVPLQTYSYVHSGKGAETSCFQTKQVLCSSIATLFVNEKGFIMIGDPISSLQRTVQFASNVKAFHYTFGEDSIEYKPGSKPMHSNTISPGGWHFVIYHKTSRSTKHLRSFFKNLERFTNQIDETEQQQECVVPQFSDISFSF